MKKKIARIIIVVCFGWVRVVVWPLAKAMTWLENNAGADFVERVLGLK